MRDDVCIVLNEHEPQKTEMAEALTKELNNRGLSCARLKPTADLVAIIRERSPRILVLDYLIGDIATALDILPELRDDEAQSDTSIILWTDEPSTAVAVSAMKLGAADYIPFGVIDDLPKVVGAIETELSANSKKLRSSRSTKSSGEIVDPIAQSESFLASLRQAESAAAREASSVIIQGPIGSGRSTVARFIHGERRHGGQLIEIDCDVWLGQAADICGSRLQSVKVPMLSYSTTLILDHVEFESGEILNALHEMKDAIWTGAQNDPPMLIAATTCAETALAWSRLLDADVIKIDSLNERGQDFWPLVQQFHKESRALVSSTGCNLSAPLVQAMAELTWPGNVKQLRAVMYEVVTGPLDPETFPEVPAAE
ncbi:MAG: sigma 54-interacting transcriptional regulator, partial [Bdellovibrionales bacterium]|nr:sigma 54-interacting transcriptional regulator [Bdellovibrionales bacterium]